MSPQPTLHLAAQTVGLAAAFSAQTDPIRRKYDLAAMSEAAQLLEGAKFDAVFEADPVIFDIDDTDSIYANLAVDATAAAAALAGVTRRIGLVSTATTTFNVPYGLARQFQTIDQLSGGRLGWNAVTSFGGERQFGFDELPDQTIRYQRAAEFVDIVQGLWRGWHADAVGAGAGNRPRIDAGKIDQLSYEGEFLRAHGALGIPRSPQGWPVQWQAGASAEGLRFAAKYAEAIYSASPDLEHAIAFKSRLAAAVAGPGGRGAPVPLVFPGIHLTGAASQAEAEDEERALTGQLDFEAGLRSLALAFGAVAATERGGDNAVDLSDLDLDQPIPVERIDALPDSETLRRRRSRSELYRGLARKGLTLRQLIVEHLQGHAHYRFTGSFEQIADELQLWFEAGGADGIVLNFHNGAAGVRGFIEHVVPRLQDRGLYRRDYSGSTLREHLGLPIPG